MLPLIMLSHLTSDVTFDITIDVLWLGILVCCIDCVVDFDSEVLDSCAWLVLAMSLCLSIGLSILLVTLSFEFKT